MFHRMFGRRKSPVNEGETADAVEATEEKPEDICSDGFIVLGDAASGSNGFDPPPGYTVQGANAFLSYSLDPKSNSCQRSLSFEGTSAIDGIPFKFGSNVLLENSVLHPFCSIFVEEMMSKIKSFNWDDYEYSFELERSIMKEFNSTEYSHA